MPYSGNPSLSPDVQKRVLGTFEQTLGLAAEGSRQEAQLGCEFVLRMDPQFEPARRLQERLRDSAGPVRTDDLLSPAAAAPVLEADPFGFNTTPDLPGMPGLSGVEDDFSLDLPELPDSGPVLGAGGAGGGADLRSRIQSLLDERRFPELMTLAQSEHAAITADPRLGALLGEAQERMEAEPYVQKFLAGAREAARNGNSEEVKRFLDKARALDPDHPGIAEISHAAASPSSIPEPSFDLGFDEAPALDFGAPSAALDFSAGALPELSFGEPAAPTGPGAPDFGGAPLPDFGASSMPSFDDGFLTGGGGDSESEQRIRQLLAEGQTAYDAGDLQGAIDSWSRIFLIDIDHQEAARRIDQARKLKAESERQVEEVFHDGVAKLEAGDAAGARRDFERALEIQPGYFQAREYLQQLDSGQVPAVRAAGSRDLQAEPLLTVPSEHDIQGDLKEEILIPPDPNEMAGEARTKRAAAPKAREGRARRLFVLVGSAVLLLVAVGGYLLYQNKDRLFPNSQSEDAASPGDANANAANADPIEHATKLHKAGKTSIALAQLKRIAPGDPRYQQAQSLIQQWSAEPEGGGVAQAPQPPAAPTPPPISPERLALLSSAREAYTQGLYLDAVQRFEQAVAGGQLGPSEADMLADAKRRVEPLAAQIDLVRQHEWEHALHDLWRLHEAEPGNHDVTRLMVDSYYNLGVRDLQRSDPDKAVESFQEALKLAPSDAGLKRNLLFTQTYQGRPQDLLYRIYVKHLPAR